ncbi:MAG TPA: YetF domain-containing protein [Chthonomonadaceae bacterium]|nr:YetF domain-containing protein [Chthonomonadaceae bacterium]
MTPAFSAFLLAIAARTVIVVVFLIVGLRLLGKRELGQMNIYDLALIMALANAVQNAMTSGNGNLSVGFVSAGALIGVGKLLSLLFARSSRWEARIVGTPTLVVYEGKLVESSLRREHLSEEQVMMALRQHGLTDLDQVEMAVLEVDGSLSVVPRKA